MLTDAAIRRITLRDKQFKVSDMHGLYLLVSPQGGRYWRWNFSHGGKRQTLALGVYPEVSLKEAREKRMEAKKLLSRGTNPSSHKRLARVLALNGGNSFGEVAQEWLTKIEAEGRSRATMEKMRWLLRYAQPIIGERPIGDLSAPEVLAVLRMVEAKRRYESARRLRTTIGSIMRYAIATGRAQRDVTADLQGALITPKVTHRAAVTDPGGVGELLRALWGYEGQPAVEIALKVGIYTFVRPGELRHAEWTEFDPDLAIWTIPAAKMKMGREHRVPLSTQVMDLIEALHPLTGHSKYLFPSIRDLRRPMSENTVNGALRRLGYDKTQMTGHGFRATASTLLNESRQWHPDAIERQLAHVESNDVRRAYLRGEHWRERVKMMQFWSDYLDQLRAAEKVIKSRTGWR
jgi:integrase